MKLNEGDSYKILIVEDEPKLVKIIEAYLTQEQFQVHTANDGNKGLDKFHKVEPDLIILDLMLPGLSGEEIAKNIRTYSQVPIIMLTAKGEEEDKLTGLGIGADDYLVKPVSPREVTAKVKTVLRRAKKHMGRVQQDIINYPPLYINTISHEVYVNDHQLSLTPTEYHILKLLALYPNKVFSRDNLRDHIYGYLWEGDPRTIDAHIKNLRQKVESDPKHPEYVKTIFGMGYQFMGNKEGYHHENK